MPFSLHAHFFVCFFVGIKYNLMGALESVCLKTWIPATIFASVSTTVTLYLAATVTGWMFTWC